MMIQFSGENNWDAIINHNSLNIEEEQSFEDFIKSMKYSKNEDLDILEELFEMWESDIG